MKGDREVLLLEAFSYFQSFTRWRAKGAFAAAERWHRRRQKKHNRCGSALNWMNTNPRSTSIDGIIWAANRAMMVKVLDSGSPLPHHSRQGKYSGRKETWDSADGILSEDTIPVMWCFLTTYIDSYRWRSNIGNSMLDLVRCKRRIENGPNGWPAYGPISPDADPIKLSKLLSSVHR